MKLLLMVVREDTSFLQHRLPIAFAARNLGYSIHVLSLDKGQSSEIERLGFASHGLPCTNKAMPLLGALITLLHYIRIFRKLRPDVIHLSSTYVCLLGGLAALFARRAPVIISFTGLGYLFTSKRLGWHFLIKLAWPVIHFIWNRPKVYPLFQNWQDAEELRSLGLSTREPTLIAGAGVDIEVFKPRARARTDDKFVIGCAARLLKDKGIQDVVAAMKIVRKASPKVLVKFAGRIDPFNPSSLSNADIAAWKNLPGVEFVGSQSDMPAFWLSCDAAILASLREGMPKAMLEAAATGLPLLASDVIGCRDVVDHGRNGYLFQASDPEDIARAILNLCNDPDFCRAAGHASRQLILDKGMDQDAVAEGYTGFLKRITTVA